MNISGIINEKEDEKVKALLNIQIGDFQLRGFKLYEGENENGEKQLKMITPSYMEPEKDEKGEVKKTAEGKVVFKTDADGNVINKHPIIINPELSNKANLTKELEKMLVDAYNEFKEKKATQINQDIEAPDFEKGELNVSNTWVVNTSKIKNTDYQLKSTNQLLIGAFRINEVNLIYNTNKNDYNFIAPSYESTTKDGKKENRGFFIPKNSEAYSKVKDKLVNTFKSKNKELIDNYNKQKLAKQKTNAENQAPVQGTENKNAATMK